MLSLLLLVIYVFTYADFDTYCFLIINAPTGILFRKSITSAYFPGVLAYFFNFSIIFHFWYFTFLFLFDIIVIG